MSNDKLNNNNDTNSASNIELGEMENPDKAELASSRRSSMTSITSLKSIHRTNHRNIAKVIATITVLALVCIFILIYKHWPTPVIKLEWKLSDVEVNSLIPPVFSGDFTGIYDSSDSGGSFTKKPAEPTKSFFYKLADQESKVVITRSDDEKSNGTYKIGKQFITYWNGEPDGEASIVEFTDGVPFMQKRTADGAMVNTTITIEGNVWNEVQQGSPIVTVTRVFFDTEMTATFESDGYIYVKKYIRSSEST